MKPNPDPVPPSRSPRLVSDDVENEDVAPLVDESGETAADTDTPGQGDGSYDIPGPAWKGYAFAAIPVLTCLFGAGREAWSKGLGAALMALVLIVFAPKRRLPLPPALCLLGLLLAPLLMYLPADWLHVPDWRLQLTQVWEIALSSTLTPQAWVTAESWLLFATLLTWLAWCLTRGFSGEQRRSMLQTLALGGVLLCVLSIMEEWKWMRISWWPRNQPVWGEAFGPFANRNHISSIAAITVVLCASAAYDAHRRKAWTWALFLVGALAPLGCILMNTSRAGIILLFIGLTTWFGTAAMRKGFFQKLAVTVSLIFVIATLLVMSGGGLTARLNSSTGSDVTSMGGRGMLFVETLGMAAQSPWLGVGLGNFEPVFPLLTTYHEPKTRFLHPESDLLWLLVEGGLLTVVPGVLLLLWLFQTTGPWFGKKNKNRASMRDRRLRNTAAIAFGMGALHGLVDVPNHEMGYAFFMALLAGIAIRPRRLSLPSGWGMRLTFRTAGLAVLVLGAAWFSVSLGNPVLPGKSAAQKLREKAGEMAGTGSTADALLLIDQAIRLNPMNFALYYERARLRLQLGQPSNDALFDFSRSRALEPHYARLCYTEGVYWLDYDPQYSGIGWREFLQRNAAFGPGIYGHYRMMLNHADRHPGLRATLWSLATTADLKMDFLEGVRTREEFDMCLRSLLTKSPDLLKLTAAQRERLFQIWYQQGNQTALISALETNAKWRDDGWRLLAEHYAKNSEFQRACQTIVPYLPAVPRTAPGTSTDIPALERAVLFNPTDARRGIDLFQAQKMQGDLSGALHTLEKVAALPNAPTYIRQEIAAIYIMQQDFRRAWEYLREAMQKR